MKISIVIPIYNVEKYILNCLLSVINQKRTRHIIECILVDDCGDDNSINIAQKFIEENRGDIEFKLIRHEYNRGLSAARNTGISACSGDYVLFLDSDDTLPIDSVYNLSTPLESYSYDFILGEVRVLGMNNKAPQLNLPEGAYMGNDIVRKTYLHYMWYMMAWNKLCSLNFLRSHKLFFEEGLIHEDDMWSFLLSLHADSFYVVRKFTYNYIIRDGSITTGKKQASHIDAYLNIANKIVYYIKYYSLDSSYVLFCHRYILGTYVYLRYLGIIEGYKYFKKIVDNDLYVYYRKTLLLKESYRYIPKIVLTFLPHIGGYCIFRTFSYLTYLKQKTFAKDE